MEQLIFYLKLGFMHILDINAYDHFLFIVSITIPFSLRNFKRLFWIITFFTIGHSTSIILSTFKIFNPDMMLIEILIPVTIIASAISNIFITKNLNKVDFLTLFISTFFGIIHGFGFANYFNQITFNDSFDYIGLIGFSFGVELAQLITVLILLMLISFFNSFIKRNYRIYIALSSVIVCILTAILYI
ncbi:MAG: HupE/UreJ family protein [Flavobacteriaceae bacterium]|nr:HupE/UreJ family protein [Flavobacteriaceae bacterium]MBL6680744.1 HupE/UreJ family protein [Flavobacteriaceae bacterium]